jgi:hypothetical protein
MYDEFTRKENIDWTDSCISWTIWSIFDWLSNFVVVEWMTNSAVNDSLLFVVFLFVDVVYALYWRFELVVNQYLMETKKRKKELFPILSDWRRRKRTKRKRKHGWCTYLAKAAPGHSDVCWTSECVRWVRDEIIAYFLVFGFILCFLIVDRTQGTGQWESVRKRKRKRRECSLHRRTYSKTSFDPCFNLQMNSQYLVIR